ncbi:MAG: TolC family protein [Candidatus Latescibacteria bacterium]|nr:TolC family protein [Candidatus Latescibacterota bacterium]
MSITKSPSRYIFPFLLLALSAGLIPLGRAHAEAMLRIEAIRLVVERNPQVEAARNAYEAARARARQAGALPNPEFEFEELPKLGSSGDHGEHTIGVSQRVEFPLKWWHRFQAGRQHAEAARLAVFEMAKLDISLQAKQAYDRIALQKSLLQHARQDLDLAQNILRQAHIRFKAGDVSQLDVMRASVEVGRATNRRTAAQNDLSVAKTALNALLARPLQTPFALADSLVYQPVETHLDQLTAAALKQRPDLAGTELQLKALQSQQAAATAAYWPDLNVGLALQQQHGGHEEDSWLLRFSMEVPLWAFSRQRGERAEAKAEVAKVAAERDVVRYQVLLETEQAYLDLKTAEEQVILFQGQILPEAKRAFAVAGRSYDEGKLTYLELLEAQRTYIETQIEYAQALFEYRMATAALERAIAGPLSANFGE